jgi:peptide/nickel transport system ATP-binding protein
MKAFDLPLLDITGLRLETKQGQPLVHDLSLSLPRGACLALVGESGSGKTLASRAIVDLLPSGVRRSKGQIRLNGEDLTELRPSKMRAVRGRDIGMVFQEPMASLNPALTIGEQLAEGLRLHLRLGRHEIRERCLDMLRRVRISDPQACLGAHPHVFSGGMRQRIMLASVMLLKPKLLIADEPTTALDSLSQKEVMELMTALAREEGASILLITHDLGLVARYSQSMAVLEKGCLVESGDTSVVMSGPKHAYTRRLLAALPRRGRSTPAPVTTKPPLLEVRGACIDYPGASGLLKRQSPHRVVRMVDLNVMPGEIVALVGGSGSGKSTLGRAVLGLRSLSAGQICFDGADISTLSDASYKSFRRQAQMVFQDPFSSLDPRVRIADQVGAALRHVQGPSLEERRARVRDTLTRVGLSGFEERLPHQMSGGQRQRVAIARAVASRPRLVVADEPVSALDATISRQVLDLFRELQTEYGFACLFITHDLNLVEEIASRVYVLSAGEVVESGPVADVFSHPSDAYTRDLLAARPHVGGDGVFTGENR